MPKGLHLTLSELRLRLHNGDRSRWEGGNLDAERGNFLLFDAGVTKSLGGFDLVETNADESNWERNLRFELPAFRRELEVVEVVPAVDNLEDILLRAPRLDFVRLQQAGAATDHLPEFRVTEDRLCEDKIDDFPHVDAGIQHVPT